MKKYVQLVLCSLFTFAIMARTSGEESMAGAKAERLPRQIGKHTISEDIVRQVERLSSTPLNATSASPRATYLIGILTNNVMESSQTNNTEEVEEANHKKASAIRLLGALKTKAAIQPLVNNIEFQDKKTKTHPVVHALAAIGEDAVPDLMDVVKREEEGKKIELAVQSLMIIKGGGYKEFVSSQKSKLSSDAWRNLLRFAIDD